MIDNKISLTSENKITEHKSGFFRCLNPFAYRLPGIIALFTLIFCLSLPLNAISESACRLPNPILAIPSLELVEAYELLENGDFETKLPNLKISRSGDCPAAAIPASGRLSSQSAHSGNRGYHLVNGDCKTSFMVQTQPDKAEDTTLSFWVRSRKGQVIIQPEIIFSDSASRAVFRETGEPVTITGDWQQIQLTAATTEGFIYADAGFKLPAGAELDIDDISVSVPIWKEFAAAADAVTIGTIKVPAQPRAPIWIRFSIHIEDTPALISQETYFLYKTAIMRELSRIFYENGGFLNIQPEIEWVVGAQKFAPDTLRDLATGYRVTYSTHSHGPNCVDAEGNAYGASDCSCHQEYSREISDIDVAKYVNERRELLESMSGTEVIDHNGNFDLVNKDILYDQGIRVLSGFKNKNTQTSYDYLIMNPWRPTAADALTDSEKFLTHDPAGKLVYLPGIGQALSRRHFRIKEQMRRYLSQYINRADPTRVNTLNFIVHIDSFTSSSGLADSEYLRITGRSPNFSINFSAELQQDLAYWSEMLNEVVAPLVAGGYLQWGTQQQMLSAYNDWEDECDNHGQTDSLSTRIPSPAAGETGIAIKINVPEKARYADGAPVAINIVGGFDGVGLNSTIPGLTEQGFIQIGLNLPGAGLNQDKSGGTYDYRGADSVAALREVTLFALDKVKDINGKTLTELIEPLCPLSHNVGIIGLSNGGNLSLCSAGIFAEQLKDLAWLVNWESPVGNGMPGGEAGTKNSNPPINPAYNPDTGEWDLSTLSYDSTLPIGSDPRHPLKGGLYFDLNHNHQADPGTDFIPPPLTFTDLPENTTTKTKVYYSERLTDYAITHNLYPIRPPEHLSSLSECENFWYWRDGAQWIKNIVAANPEIRFLVIASEKDHVQTAADHPHILIQYDAFREAKAQFVRINPDASYINLLATEPLGDPPADNDAGTQFDHLSIRNALEPETVSMTTSVLAAACELADRCRSANDRQQTDQTVQGFYDADERDKIFNFAAGDYCLLLTPKVPIGYKLYVGLVSPFYDVYTLDDLNQVNLFAAELPAWRGRPLILDTVINDTVLPGEYTLYSLFVPEGKKPLPVQQGYIIGKTILRFK